MSTTPAAQLARLGVQFPGWRIIRTQRGTFIARRRLTDDLVTAHTLTELEPLLLELLEQS